jgi:hypothetical protein
MNELSKAFALINADKSTAAAIVLEDVHLLTIHDEGMQVIAATCHRGTTDPRVVVSRLGETADEIRSHVATQGVGYANGTVEALINIVQSLDKSYSLNGQLRYPMVLDLNGLNVDLAEALNIAFIAACRVTSQYEDLHAA